MKGSGGRVADIGLRHAKENHRPDDGDDQAPQVQPRHALRPEEVDDEAADEDPDDPGRMSRMMPSG